MSVRILMELTSGEDRDFVVRSGMETGCRSIVLEDTAASLAKW